MNETETRDPAAEPTPEQWVDKFLALNRSEQVAYADRARFAFRRSALCWEAAHEQHIDALEAEVARKTAAARAEVARLRQDVQVAADECSTVAAYLTAQSDRSTPRAAVMRKASTVAAGISERLRALLAPVVPSGDASDDTDLSRDDLARMASRAEAVEVRGPLPAGGRFVGPAATFTATGATDWVDDDAMPAGETMARFEALGPVPSGEACVRGDGSVCVSDPDACVEAGVCWPGKPSGEAESGEPVGDRWDGTPLYDCASCGRLTVNEPPRVCAGCEAREPAPVSSGGHKFTGRGQCAECGTGYFACNGPHCCEACREAAGRTHNRVSSGGQADGEGEDVRGQVAQAILRHFGPPDVGGGSWRLSPYKAADDVLAVLAARPVLSREALRERIDPLVDGFIREWVPPAMQGHLLDDDGNAGERLREALADVLAGGQR